MAIEQALQCITLPASGDLSGAQYKFVKMSATGIAVCSAITDIAIGILQDKPTALGQPCQVGIKGISKCMAGAALATIGTRIAPTAAGKAQAAVSTQFPAALTNSVAAADLDIIDVVLLGTTLTPLP